MSASDFSLVVEDPGAANYLAPVAESLRHRGRIVRLAAGGLAVRYLRERGVVVDAAPPASDAAAWLKRESPRVLVTGTSEDPDGVGLALIDAARTLAIPSVGAVDAFANSAHRFRGRDAHPLAHAPDWLMVPDEPTRQSYVALRFRTDRISVCGHPHTDVVLDRKEELDRQGRSTLRDALLPAAAGRRVLVFVAEISGGLDPQQFQRSSEYTLAGRGGQSRTEVVLEELLDAVALLPERPYMVLRLHPKNATDDFAALQGEFDLVSTGGSPLELVYAADLVVGMTSMVLYEALLLDRRVLAIVPRPVEQSWLPALAEGAIPCAYERTHLRQLLGDGLMGSGVQVPLSMRPARSRDLATTFLETLLARPDPS